MSDPALISTVDGGPLFVVGVEDQIDPTLAGWGGASYLSPPQPLQQAHTLIGLLLGWATEPVDGQTRWRCAVAGGTRTVTLDPVASNGHHRPDGPATPADRALAGR